MNRLTDQYAFVNTSSTADPDCSDFRLDISAFRTTVRVKRGLRYVDYFWEIKFEESSDGFEDHTVERDSIEGQLTRGQIALYTAAQRSLQFRTHTFSVLVCGSRMRFMRWDSSGATVSRAFNYVMQPELLAEFQWRMDHLNEQERGYDLSALEAEDGAEIHLARTKLKMSKSQQFMRVMVADRDKPDSEDPYLIPLPSYTPRSPFGRISRSSLAYDVKRDRVVYLKESWRVDGNGLEKEGETYRKLENHGVGNIARFDRGNDVRDYETKTQKMTSEPWVRGSIGVLERHKLYRMTLVDVGRDLTSFKSSWECINAVACAMKGIFLFVFVVSSADMCLNSTSRGIRQGQDTPS